MKNEVISERQGVILITLFIVGSSLLLGSGGQAKQDAWIAMIIAMCWAVILLLMFSRILSLYPGKDLFDILEIVMGKVIGKIISILMIWFAFHLGTLVLRNLSDFTNTLVFPDTPVVVPMISFVILIIWVLKEGIEVLGRWSEFFVWVIGLTIIIITLLSTSEMDISRLKPILGSGFMPILKGTLSSLSFPFGETVVFTMVFSNIAKIKSYKRTFLLGMFLGGGFVFLGTLRNILVLGSETVSKIYFPSTLAISLIHLGEFLQRIEIAVLIVFIVCVFVKVSICVFAVSNGISKFFGFTDYKFISTPVVLLMLNFSFFIYKSNIETTSWAFNVWPYYSMVFEVIIPLIVFIIVEVKNRISAGTKSCN